MSGQPPYGTFVVEQFCRCGFMVDRYEGRARAVEFVDPDAGLTITRCPGCDADLELQLPPASEPAAAAPAWGDTLL